MARAIIPAAGFGTRMGMKPNQSKEMIIEPGYADTPIINYSIELAYEYGFEPLVITRLEKSDLIVYLMNHNIPYIVIEPKGEWPDTILASQDYWDKDNILILPDTRFEPTNIIQLMKNDLENGAFYSVGLHSVTDSSKWCVVNNYCLIEKPEYNENSWAMGLIGWKRTEGKYLFETLSIRNKYYQLENASFQYLDSFIDITRTGKIKY